MRKEVKQTQGEKRYMVKVLWNLLLKTHPKISYPQPYPHNVFTLAFLSMEMN